MGESSHYPDEAADGPRREATHWLSVLHGAKTILLWKFGGRVTDNQTDHYNLCAWDGSVTERAKINARVARTFLGNEDLFLNKSYRSDVAILFSTTTALLVQVQNKIGDFIKSRAGAWKLLRDLRIPGDFVSDVQAMEGRLDQYKVVILPWLANLTPSLVQRLRQFVEQGGTLIADRMLGIYDENGGIFPQAPGYGLTEVFGGYMNDFLLGTNAAGVDIIGLCKIPPSQRAGGGYAIIHPSPQARTIGVYRDASPAVVGHSFAAGQAFWFGTDIWKDYWEDSHQQIADTMRWMLGECGIQSEYAICGDEVQDVEFGALSDDEGQRVHFIINLTPKAKSFRLNIASARNQTYRDLLSGYEYDGALDFNPIDLRPWETRILRCTS